MNNIEKLRPKPPHISGSHNRLYSIPLSDPMLEAQK